MTQGPQIYEFPKFKFQKQILPDLIIAAYSYFRCDVIGSTKCFGSDMMFPDLLFCQHFFY